MNQFARGNTRDLRVLWALEEMQHAFDGGPRTSGKSALTLDFPRSYLDVPS